MKKVIGDQISDCSQRAKRYREAVSFKNFWKCEASETFL